MAKAANRPSAVTAESASDYYNRFRQFCSFYPLRERHLTDSILKAIGKLSDSKSLSILDVGSADGELLAEIVSSLTAGSDIKLRCVAVEPNPAAFSRLEVTAGLLCKPGRIAIDCIQGKIEDVMAGQQPIPLEKFDFILCSHVFYHLKNWPEVIEKFLSLLNRAGCISVILDSHNSPLYKFKESLGPVLGNRPAIQEYGEFSSAEDFLKFLTSSGLHYFQEELDWKLAVCSNNLVTELEDILTFLYRFALDDRRGVKETIQKFAKRFKLKELYVFPWKEKVFSIRAGDPPK